MTDEINDRADQVDVGSTDFAIAELAFGMEPLPDETDQDRLIAACDVLGRCGMAQFEVGYDDEKDSPNWWYAQVARGDGAGFIVEGAPTPHDAAERLARKIINGARCTHCGKVTTLTQLSSMGAHSTLVLCRWTREGKRWERGCRDTHAEHERTKEAINEYLQRKRPVDVLTNSPEIRER